MTDTNKEVINELYNAALVTAGVAGLSMVPKKRRLEKASERR
jgi:hypothetical protein